MKLLELFRNSKKEHDTDKILAYHEAAPGLCAVSFWVLSQYTSLIGYRGTKAFNHAPYSVDWDIV